MVHIRLIRALQNLGLSLAEIRSYFDNTASLDEQIDRLVLLRNQLDQYIAQLRLRQSTTDEPEIRQVTLPGFTAFCRDFHDADLEWKDHQPTVQTKMLISRRFPYRSNLQTFKNSSQVSTVLSALSFFIF